jgi:hypothetical protein
MAVENRYDLVSWLQMKIPLRYKKWLLGENLAPQKICVSFLYPRLVSGYKNGLTAFVRMEWLNNSKIASKIYR